MGTSKKSSRKDRRRDGKSGGKKGDSEKVVRDSFTMPKAEHERLARLKERCVKAGVAVKKSELLRAGVQLLDEMSDKQLRAAMSGLKRVKTGRPPGKKG